MSGRGRARWAAAVVWAAAAVVLTAWPGSSPAGAIPPDAYGWWAVYQQAPGGSNLPVPPGIPEDGIFVSGVPQTQAGTTVGIVAYGAIRARIAEGSPARILLSVADGSTAANAVVLACPTTSGWDPFVNGRWEGRPTYDCVRGVQGVVAPTGDTITFELAGTAQKEPGLLDVAIVPGGPVRIAFERPDGSSVQPAMEASSDDPDSSFDEPLGDPAADSENTLSYDGGFTGDTLALPPFGPDPAAVPTPPAQIGEAPVAIGLRQAFPTALPVPLVDERTDRIIAVSLLLALGVLLWWLGGREARAPRRLGSLGMATGDARVVTARTAGIGRFARPRTGAPDRL